MAIPTPRFEIGQQVFTAEVNTTDTTVVPCPDCDGARLWKLVAPGSMRGQTMPCPTCHDWDAGSRGVVKQSQVTARVRTLTVGMVRVAASKLGGDVEYMCEETGIGSGGVWPERLLRAHASEVESELPALVAKRKEELEDGRVATLVRVRADLTKSLSTKRWAVRAAKRALEEAERSLARFQGRL